VVLNDLATQAGLNIHIDAKILETIYGPDRKPLRVVNIKWRNLTARQALVAVLDNYGYVAIPDPNTRVVRITIKDPTVQEPLVLKMVKLEYTNPTNMVNLIKPTLSSRSQIQADVRGNKLIMLVTESEFASVSNIIARVDTAVPQILIEAQFIETARNPKSIKGIDWTGTLEAQNFTFGNGFTKGTTSTTVPGTPSGASPSLPSGAPGAGAVSTPAYSASTVMGTVFGRESPLDTLTGGLSVDTVRGFYPHAAFLSADGVKAVLSFLNTENDTKFIAQPRAVAMDGTPVELSSIRNVPVFEEEQGNVQGGIQQASTVKPRYDLMVRDAATQRETVLNEVGIKLLVTPRQVGKSDIHMDLRPEVSAVEGVERKLLGGRVNESPIFRRQKLNTVATVPSGNTLVLGGLVTDEISKAYNKVPVLGDVPGLGLLFRKDSKSRSRRNMLIFVTPSLVTDGDFQPTPSDFLKTKPQFPPDLDEPAWDTGAPASKYRPLF
jgi:general secretion pathway protein D